MPTVEHNGNLAKFLYVDAIDKDNFTIIGSFINCKDRTMYEAISVGKLKGQDYEGKNPDTTFQKIQPKTIGEILYNKVCPSNEFFE